MKLPPFPNSFFFKLFDWIISKISSDGGDFPRVIEIAFLLLNLSLNYQQQQRFFLVLSKFFSNMKYPKFKLEPIENVRFRVANEII